MNEHQLVPHIRFWGFEEEWEEDKISNISLVSIGNTPPTNKKEYYSEKGISWVTPSNISNNGRIIDERHLSKEGAKIARIVPRGSILITSIASIGKNALVKENTAFNQQINAVTPIDDFDSYFIYTLSIGLSKKMKTIAASGIMQIVNKKDFSKMKVKFPSFTEQQKIGNLFAKLDQLLELEQQKLDQLGLLKKALLQDLFPAQGAKIPALRFQGFEDEWEEKKFSNLYKNKNEKNDLTFGPDKIISVANMYFKQTLVKSDEKYMMTYNIFNLGDIAFEGHKNKNFAFGRFVENTIGDGIISHVFNVFTPIMNYDIDYWKYAINNENLMGPVLQKSTIKATMMNNLIAKDFLKQKVVVPLLSEQQKIGTFLAKLDHLIELEQQKLDKIKQVKKALLQNMFVK